MSTETKLRRYVIALPPGYVAHLDGHGREKPRTIEIPEGALETLETALAAYEADARSCDDTAIEIAREFLADVKGVS